MDDDKMKNVMLDVIEASLAAQLQAVKKLRGRPERSPASPKSMSQVDMVYDILQRAGGELHISEIVARVEKFHGVKLERESIVSALAKKVKKGDRFVRVGKNTYGLAPQRPRGKAG